MPEVESRSIPLAHVYDAFDALAYRAFRVAMRRSRGGVVRIADLVAALAETQPERTAAAFQLDRPAVNALARQPISDTDLVPMANEPALRAILVDAYRRAGERRVTPEHLLEALAPYRPMPPLARPVRNPDLNDALEPSSPARWDGEGAAEVLGRWLAAQSKPGPERDAEIRRLSLAPGAPGSRRD
jgi:hypothetical protein